LTAVRTGRAGAPGHVLARATILQQLASMLPEAFPEGSAAQGSRALPAIWTSPAEFSQRIQAIQSATQALVAAAGTGDTEQIASAQMAVQQACGACHMQFRGPPPAN
jgi:cytochrome c556